MTHADISDAIDQLLPELRDDLDHLVRIPSVSAPGFDPAPVRTSAESTASLLERAGYGSVRLLDHGDAHPAVFGEAAGPEGSPTVLLYAHHDVQPPGEADGWQTEPFQPVERDGRLFGRGTADDKCGIVAHAASLRAFEGSPPVGLKVFVEGEEEIGSAHLPGFLADHGELLAADVIVIADSGNWRVGVPAITTSLRGLVSARVEVSVLEAGVHSGQFGGAVPDALTILCRILASLHDDAGNVAIPGLIGRDADPLDLTEEELRGQAGVLPGVGLIGDGSLTGRMWTRPAAAVLALDATPTSKAINQLIPSAAAKVSVRIAPGESASHAMAALVAHLESRPAWGATVAVTPLETGEPFSVPEADTRVDAFRTAMETTWGRPAVDMGVGGSIPFVAAFHDAYPEAAIVLTGASDPTSRAHGPNESLHLQDWRHSMVAQAEALRILGDTARP